jgi:hypothetical protein
MRGMILLSLSIRTPPEDISRRRPKLFAFIVISGFLGGFRIMVIYPGRSCQQRFALGGWWNKSGARGERDSNRWRRHGIIFIINAEKARDFVSR